MIIVMGYIYLDPSDVSAFFTDVEAITPGAAAASGCHLYSVTLADAANGRLLVTERWQSQAGLTAHLEKPATLAFLQKWGGKLRSEVLKYDASHERPLLD